MASEAKPSMPPPGRALRLTCDLGEIDGFASLAMTGFVDSICSATALDL
jgi:hypothetical protein